MSTSCDDGDDDDVDQQGATTASETGSLVLNVVTTNSSGTSTSLVQDKSLFRPSSIASGAPEEFTIYVTKITLQDKTQQPVPSMSFRFSKIRPVKDLPLIVA